MGKIEIGILVGICLATIGLYGLEWLLFIRSCRRKEKRLEHLQHPAWLRERIHQSIQRIKNGPVVGPFRYVDLFAKERTSEMLNAILLCVGLPATPAADVVLQKIIVERSPAGPFLAREVVELVKGTDWIETPIQEVTIKALQDSTVAIKYVVQDDAGNWSNMVSRSLVARDTIPPQLFGEIEAAATDEEPVEDDAADLNGIFVSETAGGEPLTDAEQVELAGTDAGTDETPADAAAGAGEEEAAKGV